MQKNPSTFIKIREADRKNVITQNEASGMIRINKQATNNKGRRVGRFHDEGDSKIQ